MRRVSVVACLVALGAFGLGCGKKTRDAIVPYGRENNSGTYAYFKEHVLKDADFAANVQTLPGTAAVINAVSLDARAIGYGGIGYVKGVRALGVKKDAASPAVEPTLQNVVDGSYPISRYLYFYTIGEPQGAVKDLIDWVRGPGGQKVCAEVGYYPLPENKQASGPAARPSAGQTITMKGSDTMVILGQRWAEVYMQKYPGSVIQVTGGGSGTGIKALIEGSTHICQASRAMKAAEKEQVRAHHGKEAIEFAVAMDGLAVFVHESNPIREITLDQLKDIYTGKVRSWKELGAPGTGK